MTTTPISTRFTLIQLGLDEATKEARRMMDELDPTHPHAREHAARTRYSHALLRALSAATHNDLTTLTQIKPALVELLIEEVQGGPFLRVYPHGMGGPSTLPAADRLDTTVGNLLFAWFDMQFDHRNQIDHPHSLPNEAAETVITFLADTLYQLALGDYHAVRRSITVLYRMAEELRTQS